MVKFVGLLLLALFVILKGVQELLCLRDGILFQSFWLLFSFDCKLIILFLLFIWGFCCIVEVNNVTHRCRGPVSFTKPVIFGLSPRFLKNYMMAFSLLSELVHFISHLQRLQNKLSVFKLSYQEIIETYFETGTNIWFCNPIDFGKVNLGLDRSAADVNIPRRRDDTDTITLSS